MNKETEKLFTGAAILFGVLVGVAATKFSLWIAVPMFIGMSILLLFFGMWMGGVGDSRPTAAHLHETTENVIRAVATRVAGRCVEEMCPGSYEQVEEGVKLAQEIVDDELRAVHGAINSEKNGDEEENFLED
jgi:hypothetical protein